MRVAFDVRLMMCFLSIANKAFECLESGLSGFPQWSVCLALRLFSLVARVLNPESARGGRQNMWGQVRNCLFGSACLVLATVGSVNADEQGTVCVTVPVTTTFVIFQGICQGLPVERPLSCNSQPFFQSVISAGEICIPDHLHVQDGGICFVTGNEFFDDRALIDRQCGIDSTCSMTGETYGGAGGGTNVWRCRLTSDNDGDGIGDNVDADDDNDGVGDAEDACRMGASSGADTDGDGCIDAEDGDDDGDGVLDVEDVCPLDSDDTCGGVCAFNPGGTNKVGECGGVCDGGACPTSCPGGWESTWGFCLCPEDRSVNSAGECVCPAGSEEVVSGITCQGLPWS